MVKFYCPNCQKKYRIDEAALPKGSSTLKCKACGQPMPLSEIIAEKKIKIVCPNCRLKYRVAPSKIPEGKKEIDCQACGQPIPLTADSSAPAPFPSDIPIGDHYEKTPAGVYFPEEPLELKKSGPLLRKLGWLVVTLLVVAGLSVAALYIWPDLSRMEPVKSIIDRIPFDIPLGKP